MQILCAFDVLLISPESKYSHAAGKKIHSQLNVVGFFCFVLRPPATVLCTLIPRISIACKWASYSTPGTIRLPVHFPKNRWQDPRESFVVFWAFCVFSLEMEFKCSEGHPGMQMHICTQSVMVADAGPLRICSFWRWKLVFSTHLGVFATKLNTLTRSSIEVWFLKFLKLKKTENLRPKGWGLNFKKL